MSDPARVTIVTTDGEQTLRPDGGAAELRLSQWLKQRGRPLNTRCGGQGLCDGCMLELVAGQVRRVGSGAVRAEPGTLRACEHALVEGASATLRVPDRSLVALQPQVIADFRLEVPIGRSPLWPAADASADGEAPLAAAVDIGTTTVAVLLVCLADGAVLARASAFNRQTHLADDVLTRINLCMTDPDALGQLREAVVNETLAPLLAEALELAGADAGQLVGVCVAANTTMLHLLVGEDPTPMGVAPFTPRFLEHRVTTLAQLGLRWPATTTTTTPRHDTEVHLLPGAAAYVGADLTAGIVATGMQYQPGNVLLVDVGTNGEIILKHGEHLLGCATAAGPAFEGSRLSSGVRAVRGAISHLDLAADPLDIRLELIGGESDRRARPIGLCGSAYVDLLAQGAATGMLTAAGRFDTARPGVADRLIDRDGARMLQLAQGPGREPVGVTEADIAALLQAKAAIAAGITTLLQRAGLEPTDINTLYLAGGFGMHMRIASAIGCGLLPGFRPEQVRLVGNTSLAGAFMAALDTAVLEEMRRAASAVEILELNLDPGFEMNYIDHLSLPEPVPSDVEPR